jgi:hypothetical protein
MDQDEPKPEKETSPEPAPSGKRALNRKAIALVAAALVLIIAAVLYFIVIKGENDTDANPPATDTTTNAAAQPDAQKLVNDISESIKTEFTYISAVPASEERRVGFVYRPADRDYYVTMGYGNDTLAAGMNFDNINEFEQAPDAYDAQLAENDAVRKSVIAKLEAAGLTEQLEQFPAEAIEDSTLVGNTYANSEKNLICNVGGLAANGFTLGCSTMDDIQKRANVLKDFVEAYRRDSDDESVFTVVNDNEELDSPIAGYTKMHGSVGTLGAVGGALALFYQTPDYEWHFFTGTQSALSCSDYNTPDLRKAYAGDMCYEGETESTVNT